MTTVNDTTRYAVARRYINWYRTRHLRVLKMLAWAVGQRYAGRDAIWREVERTCEPVMEATLGEKGITLVKIVEETLAMQGVEITPNRLAMRAWNTENNDEGNEYQNAVLAAYTATRAQP